MSGESHNETCPKCGEGMNVYTDWKPYSTAQGECIHCGFCYYTKEDVMDAQELIDRRIDYEWGKGDWELIRDNKPAYEDFVRAETEKMLVTKRLETENDVVQ
jgi:polyferredoxin